MGQESAWRKSGGKEDQGQIGKSFYGFWDASLAERNPLPCAFSRFEKSNRAEKEVAG